LSKEYGWTTDYIFTRTLREIDWRIDAINKRTSQEINFQLTLNGFTPKSADTNGDEKTKELDKDQQLAMDIALERAKQRKAKEWAAKQKN